MSARKVKTQKQSSTSDKKKAKLFSSKFESILDFKHTGLIIACTYLVIVGLISFLFHKVGDYGIETDFFWGYVPSARKFLSGEIHMDAFRGPLYPIVLGLFGFVLGDFFHAGNFNRRARSVCFGLCYI